MKLVIVGDASYSEDYKTQLRELAGENVVFTGYQFAEAYRELSSHAYAFVMACWVGGSHPVLLEQMSIGNCCVVYGMPSNREVIGDAGMTFDPEQGADDLAAVLELLIDDPEETSRIGEAARAPCRPPLLLALDRRTLQGSDHFALRLKVALRRHAHGACEPSFSRCGSTPNAREAPHSLNFRFLATRSREVRVDVPDGWTRRSAESLSLLPEWVSARIPCPFVIELGMERGPHRGP